MTKYVATPVGSGFGAQSNLNQNFEDIEDNFQRVLYRDGSTPNQMEADLDMNDHDIINVNNINTQSLAINGQQVVANETFVTPLPDPTGQSGKFIRSDGVAASWQNLTKQDVDDVAVIPVSTVADMEALTGLVNGAITHRTGYTSSRDGGDIFAEYVSGSSATPNLYDTFQPDTGGGRFLIIKTGGGPVDIRKAGAVGNGTTDASAACQSILDSGDSVFIPRSASGFVLGDINLALTNQSIVGDPARSLIIAEDSDTFNIRASKVAIQNLDVNCTAMTTSAKTLFKLKTDLGSFESIYIDRIRPISCQCLIRDANSTGTVDELYIGDILAIGNRGPGLELNDVPAFLFVRRVTIDYAGINANHRAFSVANNDGSIFTDCDVSGSAQLGTVGSQDGFYFLNTTSPWLVRCHGDTCGRYGFAFENCQYVYLTSCTGSLNDNSALWLNNTQQVQIANSFFQGRRGLGFATANRSVGKIESTSQRISIVGGAFDSGTGHGLETAGARVTTSSVRMFNNTLRGLKTNAGSSSVHAAPIFEANTVGNYDLATAFDHIGTGLANSGAVLNVTGPGAA